MTACVKSTLTAAERRQSGASLGSWPGRRCRPQWRGDTPKRRDSCRRCVRAHARLTRRDLLPDHQATAALRIRASAVSPWCSPGVVDLHFGRNIDIVSRTQPKRVGRVALSPNQRAAGIELES
jgi:hypothetical protein